MLLKSIKFFNNLVLTKETHLLLVSSTNSNKPTDQSNSKNSLILLPHQSVKSELRMVSEEYLLWLIRMKMVTLILKNSKQDLNQFNNTWTTKIFYKWCTQPSLTRKHHQMKLSVSINFTQSLLPSTANEIFTWFHRIYFIFTYFSFYCISSYQINCFYKINVLNYSKSKS